MRHIPVQHMGELPLVIGVNLRVVTTTRHGYVCQAAIHELFAGTLGLDVHEHTAGGLSLAAMGRHRVAVIEMPTFARLER
jgi:hypothetical protein